MKILVNVIMAYTLETRDQVFNMFFLKIHKTIVDGVLPLHPMLSTIRTPTHNLVKIFVPFLEPLTSSNYTIKDSFLFCKEVKKFNSNFTRLSLMLNHFLPIFSCMKWLTCLFKSYLMIKIIWMVCLKIIFVKC